MAPNIHIVTDSTCDFSPGTTADELEIAVVPLTVSIGEEFNGPETEISIEKFWDLVGKMRGKNKRATPKTSQPNPVAFEQVFSQLLKTENDKIICLTIADNLSGTYENAVQAAKQFPENETTVIDSGTLSYGLGYLAEEAVREVKAGTSYKKIVRKLRVLKKRIDLVAVLDTVEFVIAGGRLAKLARVLDRMTKFVRIKAIIRINKGESFLFQTARTTSKALEKVKRLIRERANSPGLEKISVIYTKGAENPQEFANQLAEELKREVPVISTGAVLSCHGGPGVIGAVLVKKKT